MSSEDYEQDCLGDFEEEESPDFENSPLAIATKAGDIILIKKLLASEETLSKCPQGIKIAINIAVKQGHFEAFVELYHFEKTLNKNSPAGFYSPDPLYEAIDAGQFDIVKFLYEHGHRLAKHLNLISIAAEKNHTDIIQYLHDQGEDINRVTICGSALIEATRRGHNASVEKLLELGADVNITDCQGNTAIHTAIRSGYDDIFSLILKRNSTLDCHDKEGTTPLYLAVMEDRLDMASLLLKSHADPNISSTQGTTPLFMAAKRGYGDIVLLLLDAGAMIDVACQNAMTPFYVAVKEGHYDVAKRLLSKGARLDAKDRDGNSVLFAAVKGNHLELLELLIQHHIDITVFCCQGMNVLNHAAYRNHRDIIKRLIRTGALINARDRNGRQALYYAASSGALESVILLIKRGAKITEATQKDDETALMAAARGGHLKIIKYLMPRVSREYVNAVDKNGNTALLSALLYCHTDTLGTVLSYLVDHGADFCHTNAAGHSPTIIIQNKGFFSNALPGRNNLIASLKCRALSYKNKAIKFNLFSVASENAGPSEREVRTLVASSSQGL